MAKYSTLYSMSLEENKNKALTLSEDQKFFISLARGPEYVSCNHHLIKHRTPRVKTTCRFPHRLRGGSS